MHVSISTRWCMQTPCSAPHEACMKQGGTDGASAIRAAQDHAACHASHPDYGADVDLQLHRHPAGCIYVSATMCSPYATCAAPPSLSPVLPGHHTPRHQPPAATPQPSTANTSTRLPYHAYAIQNTHLKVVSPVSVAVPLLSPFQQTVHSYK